MTEVELDWDLPLHPGALIVTLLAEFRMKQIELAKACCVSAKHINLVINGKAPLHAPLAVTMEFIFGKGVAQTLMRMQADYDVYVERKKAIDYARAVIDSLTGSEPPTS